MTKPTTGEQSSPKQTEAMSLSDAVRIVKEAIDAEETRLKKLANETEAGPVMLEGETSARYDVQMMVESSMAAKIMLKYEYPVYKVLEEDAPHAMWDELAEMVGLGEVYGVDI